MYIPFSPRPFKVSEERPGIGNPKSENTLNKTAETRIFKTRGSEKGASTPLKSNHSE